MYFGRVVARWAGRVGVRSPDSRSWSQEATILSYFQVYRLCKISYLGFGLIGCHDSFSVTVICFSVWV